MRLWNKETGKPVAIGDVLQSFRGEPQTIEGWNGKTGKVYASQVPPDPRLSQREYFVQVFPALEWREEEPNP